MKIKKGDQVLIIRGKDRGKVGKVIKALPKENKVVIEGLNLVKKHVKPRQRYEKGKIIEIPRPIFVSNVKLMCPNCHKPSRVGYQIFENSKNKKLKEKKRICKKCNKVIA
jgi:large subunit ribosomal protein L24